VGSPKSIPKAAHPVFQPSSVPQNLQNEFRQGAKPTQASFWTSSHKLGAHPCNLQQRAKLFQLSSPPQHPDALRTTCSEPKVVQEPWRMLGGQRCAPCLFIRSHFPGIRFFMSFANFSDHFFGSYSTHCWLCEHAVGPLWCRAADYAHRHLWLSLRYFLKSTTSVFLA
jgi:hypothetical protein